MKPRVFIGSSREGKKIADAIQFGLQYDTRCTVWDQAFPLSRNTVDTLLDRCADNDFAVLVFSPDDVVRMRGSTHQVPRDNVIFEAGLFMGVHGKDRVFIVVPREDSGFHLLTDLLGLTTANYDDGHAKDNALAALNPAVFQIKQAIELSSYTRYRLDIKATPGFWAGATYPLKLNLLVTNNLGFPITLESLEFVADAQIDPKAPLFMGRYKPLFLTGRDKDDKDIYQPICVLQHGKSIDAWVPIDPSLGIDELEELHKSEKVGAWHYRFVRFDMLPMSYSFGKKL